MIPRDLRPRTAFYCFYTFDKRGSVTTVSHTGPWTAKEVDQWRARNPGAEVFEWPEGQPCPGVAGGACQRILGTFIRPLQELVGWKREEPPARLRRPTARAPRRARRPGAPGVPTLPGIDPLVNCLELVRFGRFEEAAAQCPPGVVYGVRWSTPTSLTANEDLDLPSLRAVLATIQAQGGTVELIYLTQPRRLF